MYKILSPFDKHVWFYCPYEVSWKELIPRTKVNTLSLLKKYIDSVCPWFSEIDDISSGDLVTTKLREKIEMAMGLILTHNEKLDTLESIFTLLHRKKKLFGEIGLPSTIPPCDIHRMQTDSNWCGDFYSANLVLDALSQGGLRLQNDNSYLDVGCSSGSLLRVMKWYFPKGNWTGCDPVEKSINWASENLSGIEFDICSQVPPLRYKNQSVDGVIAISVWSHHSEAASRKWFNEVYRILKPNGWFLFTTHGFRSVYHSVVSVDKGLERWTAVFEGMLQSDSVFEQVWDSEDDAGNDASEWGNLYVKPEWIFEELLDRFEISHFGRGGNQKNQDVYLFTKKNLN